MKKEIQKMSNGDFTIIYRTSKTREYEYFYDKVGDFVMLIHRKYIKDKPCIETIQCKMQTKELIEVIDIIKAQRGIK